VPGRVKDRRGGGTKTTPYYVNYAKGKKCEKRKKNIKNKKPKQKQ